MKPSRLKARVFIDGANMFYTQKKLGWFFDWKKIKEWLEERFITSNFRVVTKPLKRINVAEPGEKPIYKFKANFDVEMGIEAIWQTYFDEKCNTVILFGGDSDFAFLVRFLKKELKRKVYVFSSKKMVSWELKLLADKIFYLENLKEEFFLKGWNLTNKDGDGINKNT